MKIRITENIQNVNRTLMRGLIDKTLIGVTESSRQIGKTTAVMEMAKKYDIPVIVPLETTARQRRSTFEYEKVYAANEMLRGFQSLKDDYILVDDLTEEQIGKLPVGGSVVSGFVFVNLVH